MEWDDGAVLANGIITDGSDDTEEVMDLARKIVDLLRKEKPRRRVADGALAVVAVLSKASAYSLAGPRRVQTSDAGASVKPTM